MIKLPSCQYHINYLVTFTFQGRRLFTEGKLCMEMIDPKLGNMYDVKEAEYVIHAACLCISSQPEQRPRMSKVNNSSIKYLLKIINNLKHFEF